MNRREFLFTGLGAAGALALSGCCSGTCGCGKAKFRLGMAGWTLHHLKVDEALEFCEKHGFRYLCVKNFHLPYDAKPAQVAEFLRKCADHGVTPYAAGPIEFGTADDAKRGFDFVAALGLKTMVGVPWQPDAQGRTDWSHLCSNVPLCETVAGLANEYGINFAIHNHGSKAESGVPTLWPTPDAIMRTLGPLGPRMGLCLDIAYTHADGFDVPAVIRRYGNRVFDCHVRCISDAGNGGSGVDPAHRVFDYDGVFSALKDIGYAGWTGLELAHDDPKQPMETWERWIDESRAYFENLIERT